MQRSTLVGGAATHTVDQSILDARRALTIAQEGPVLAVYADVLKHRIKLKRKAHNVFREAYESERVNELYFCIMADLDDYFDDQKHAGEEGNDNNDHNGSSAASSDSGAEHTEVGQFEADYGEPLWHVVDSLVQREAESHVFLGHHRTSNEEAEVEPWNEFWEHYRGDAAKITSKEVAVQRSLNNKKALLLKSGRQTFKFTGGQKDSTELMSTQPVVQLPGKARQKGASTVAQRILQEFAAFEEHERQRVEGNRDAPWISKKSRLKSNERASSESSSDNDDMELDEAPLEMFRSPSNRDRAKSITTPKYDRSSRHMSILGRKGDGSESPKHEKGPNRRFAQEFTENQDLFKVQMAFDQKKRPPPVFTFGGFEDYKQWQNPQTAGRHDRGKKDLAQVAAESPQWKWSMAVREHEASAQWRRRGARHDEDPRKLPDCRMPMPEANPRGTSTPRADLSKEPRAWTAPKMVMAGGTPRHVGTPRHIGTPRHAGTPRHHSGGRESDFSMDSSRKSTLTSEADVCAVRSGKKSKMPALPQPKPEFHRPWSREGLVHESEQLDTDGTSDLQDEQLKSLGPMERYAKICKHTGVHPQPAIINFLAKLPPKLDVHGLGYGAEDVLSLAAALPYRGCIEAVDLGENPRVTDASACTLLRSLASRHADTITALKLDRCPRLGKETIALCTYFLQQSLAEMQLLDISGVTVPLQEYGMLALAIKRHKKLRTVRLGETGLGTFDKKQAQQVIANIMGNKQLEALELGWNTLTFGAFKTLGASVIEHQNIASLGLANTGAKFDPTLAGSTVLVFLEYLAFDTSLTYLDLSNNAIDESAMQVLECAVTQHRQLQHIEVSRNALGIGGRRSVLRMLANPDSIALTKITADECRGGLPESSGRNPFVADPSGSYTKHMAQPAQRALLRLLLKRFCEGPDALPPSKMFRDLSLRSDSGIEQPLSAESLKLKNGVWEVPTSGVLTFEFCGGEILLKGHDETSTPASVVMDVVAKSRVRLSTRRKTLAVLCIIKSEVDEQERETWLEALGRDFILTPEQLKALCHSELSRSSCGKDPAGTCVQLLPCLIGPKDIREAMLCTHNLAELVRVQEKGKWLLCLNVFCPTGHYHLHLHNPSDRAVAERLLLLNRWENMVWFGNGHMDISQHANQKNFRNEIYNNREFIWGAQEWGIFGSEHLSFDYVSLRRPSKNSTPLPDAVWKAIINTVQVTLEETLHGEYEKTEEEEADDKNKYRNARRRKKDRLSALDVEYQNMLSVFGQRRCGWERSVAQPLKDYNVIFAMRAVSSRIYITCRQMRELLNLFHRKQARVEILVYYFLRILDWPLNAKMLRPTCRDDDWCELRRRIGYINIFPFFQPENTWFQLDLSIYEQRRCLCFLKQLADAEHHKNIKFPRIDWNGHSPNPVWDSFVAGIPITWSSFENIATKGLFEATYTCSMDLIALRLRRGLAQRVAGWTNIPQEKFEILKKILWWSVLDDVPKEVVMVLEFFCSRYKTLIAAFDDIDVNRDRSLTYREFMSGMKRRMREIGFGLPRNMAGNKTADVEGGVTGNDEKRKRGEEKRGAQKMISGMSKKDKTDKENDDMFGLDDDRLQDILHITFKFLDPNNDAELSPQEFGVLEGIWRELRLTTWEFMQHLIDCFGSLENAWAYADEDGNLLLTLEEFEKLAHLWHFDGPVRHIFMHLDRDDNGFISHDEWELLAEYDPPQWPDGV